MTYSKTCWSLSALVLAPLLLAAEQRKADAAKPENEAAPSEALQKQLKKVSDDLADLHKRLELSEQARAAETHSFNERLDKLEKSLEKATTRLSASFTPGTPASSGTLRLQNHATVAATVLLGNKPHRVAPMETLILPQPPGSFTYSVSADGFGEIRAPLTRVLGSGETFTIAINP